MGLAHRVGQVLARLPLNTYRTDISVPAVLDKLPCSEIKALPFFHLNVVPAFPAPPAPPDLHDSPDGRKRRARLEETRVLEVNRERAVAAHRVAGDGPAGEVLCVSDRSQGQEPAGGCIHSVMMGQLHRCHDDPTPAQDMTAGAPPLVTSFPVFCTHQTEAGSLQDLGELLDDMVVHVVVL